VTIDTIIVGTDFSHESDVALAHATAIAVRIKAKLVLAHAGRVPSQDEWPSVTGGVATQLEAMVRGQYDADRVLLGETRDKLAAHGIEIETTFVDTPAEAGLATLAGERDNSMIVVGSHGRAGFGRFWLGSVAEAVVANAPVPVMVARGSAPVDGYERVLVPTDFGADADAAVAVALDLRAREGAVDLVHAWRVPPGATDYWSRSRAPADVIDQVSELMSAWVKEQGERFTGDDPPSARINVAFAQSSGDPRPALDERMSDNDYDLVVMGAGQKRGRLGKVSAFVIRAANCSVVVTPAAAG